MNWIMNKSWWLALGMLLVLTTVGLDRAHSEPASSGLVDFDLLGTVKLWTGYHAGTVSGDYAYFMADQGLIVFDISDCSNPVRVGRLEDVGAYYLAADGNRLFSCSQYSSAPLMTIDISDPTNPVIISQTVLPDFSNDGYISDLDAENGRVYLAVTQQGVVVLDLTDPLSATVLDTIEVSGPTPSGGLTLCIEVSSDTLYVAGEDMGFQILNISNVHNPTIVAKYEDRIDCHSFSVMEGMVCLVANMLWPDNRDGLHLVDVSDPVNPTRVGFYEIPANNYSVFANNSFAIYHRGGGGGGEIVNISNPAVPVHAGSISMGAYPDFIGFVGDTALVLTGGGVYVYNLLSAGDEMLAGRAPVPQQLWGTLCRDSLIFVPGHYLGLNIYRRITPDSLIWLSEAPAIGHRLLLRGDYLYVTGTSFGAIYIVNIGDPSNPQVVGTVPCSGYGACSGSLDVVTDQYIVQSIHECFLTEPEFWVCFDALDVIDVSDPANPFHTSFNTDGLILSENYALTARQDSVFALFTDEQLHVIHISPTLPPDTVVVVPLIAETEYRQLSLHDDDQIFLAQDTSGRVDVFDVSSINAPILLRSIELGPDLTLQTASGSHVFLSDTLSNLGVVDYLDPMVSGGINIPQGISTVQPIGDTIMIAGDGHITFLQVSFMPCCGYFSNGFTGNTDCSTDGERTLSDITRLIDRVYITHNPLCCEKNGNVDGSTDGEITLSDITRLIDHVYISHAETAACP